MFKNKSFYILLCVALCGVFFLPKNLVMAEPISFHKEIYHKHTGGSGGGGCYSNAYTETETIEIPCGGYIHYWPELGTSQCSNCGASYYGDQSHRGCWHSTTESREVTRYSLGCGKNENSLLGNLYLQKSTDQWTKSLILQASYDVVDSMTVSEKPFIWNGAEATESDSLEVTECGDYYLRLNADQNANTEQAVIHVPIKNVDGIAPKILSHKLEPETDWIREGVTLTLDEVVDLQADGTEGCGLDETPFSYDGGENWTAEKTYFFKENGEYTICVRDRLHNVETINILIKNIDSTGPEIQKVEYDDTPNITETVLTVQAADLQADGTEGVGLSELPYSFDGGKSWTKDNFIEITNNGTIQLVVRDRLNNLSKKDVVIKNIDRRGPQISYKMEPESWTNQDVQLNLSATDLQEDGSEGAGLPKEWFSVNGGPWSDDVHLIFESNTSLHIEARDLNDNRSEVFIEIRQIDKELPWVDLSMELVKNGENSYVILKGTAGDDLSGLADEAYSWDKGRSYGKDATLKVTENGVYQLTVRDKALNWRYKQIKIDCLETKQKPIISDKKEIRKVKEVKEEKKSVSGNQITKVEKRVVKEPLIEKPAEVHTKNVKKSIWPFVLMLSGILLLLLAFLFLIFFLLNRLILIYGRNQEKYQLIGAAFAKKEEEVFVLTITEACIADCVSNEMMLKPSRFFVFRHRDEMMNILLPEEHSLLKNIEEEMKFEIMCY